MSGGWVVGGRGEYVTKWHGEELGQKGAQKKGAATTEGGYEKDGGERTNWRKIG